jgi:hypothetical protein
MIGGLEVERNKRKPVIPRHACSSSVQPAFAVAADPASGSLVLHEIGEEISVWFLDRGFDTVRSQVGCRPPHDGPTPIPCIVAKFRRKLKPRLEGERACRTNWIITQGEGNRLWTLHGPMNGTQTPRCSRWTFTESERKMLGVSRTLFGHGTAAGIGRGWLGC